ncbi:MAG: DUF2846 domain-containing protein [Gammaproteobacteria bacterium]|nr:DUF2846 domain-containing protein [Gammaproteobacteria bacterium]MBU1601434.1 DUF2846 domain-containing protein [Gammaproteobacteria bacterium]MBU2433629.1 DUF2846 domain-containing protein [Gammaproteobacteria bacterium]MBU2449833.1 DUF2846 domain-containing protein [Gammaproteobacteria bacterium]
MKFLLIILSLLTVTGCTVTPYRDLNLDTISNFRKPNDGMAGIYVYQLKTGIIGAASDVNFEIKGQPKISLNTGEYGYLEVPPGHYEYKLHGGIFPIYLPVEFEANQNYFFAAALRNLSDNSVLVIYQDRIDQAKENIMTGRYELYSDD